VAANRPGLEQLESDRGERLRQHLACVPSGDSKLLDAVQLGDGESWYCELKHARAVSEAESTAERPA
jgi:hypothetical protein